MERLRFALLDASHNDGMTRRNFRREMDADLVEFDVSDGELPETFDFDAVVVTGSRASAYDEKPWIVALVEWVREATEHGIPMLGVCFGHQVLAEALGGRVERMGDYEIGYREVTHGDDPLFEGVDETFTVFTTHQDRVAELPPGATPLAENEYGIHAFRKDDYWGVQFHPEYDTESAERITRGKDLPRERIERVLDGINAENYDAACEVKQLFENFTTHVRGTRSAATAERA